MRESSIVVTRRVRAKAINGNSPLQRIMRFPLGTDNSFSILRRFFPHVDFDEQHEAFSKIDEHLEHLEHLSILSI